MKMKISGCFTLIGFVLLGACSSGLQDDEIRQDFLTLQEKGKVVPSERITKISRGDGWSDGAEVRVYFCPRQPDLSKECSETYVSLAYQKYGSDWRLISAEPKLSP